MPDGTGRARGAAGRFTRPRLLVISQVYVPDPAAVGQYIADAAEEMARRGWDVDVITASRGYDDPSVRYPSRETRAGVTVRRLSLSSFGKRSIAVRLLAQSLFLVQAFARGLCGRRPSLIVVSTSPPFAGFMGAMLAACRGTPFAWWVMDINPDQLVATGRIATTSFAARAFDWMNRVTLRRAAAVVTLDRHMAARLDTKFPVGDRMAVIPPWPLVAGPVGGLCAAGTFRRLHGFEGKIVVMYSGNHALQHPLDTLLDAAKAFEDDPRLVFVFVGGGAGKAAVERRIAAGSTNVRSLPSAPLAELADVLSAGDVHVVTMGDDTVGIVHPSKVYSAMAAGRPILCFGPAHSHVGELVITHGIGWVVRHGDVTGAVAAISDAVAAGHDGRRDMGARASAAAAQSLAPDRLRGQFCDLLAGLAFPERSTVGTMAEEGTRAREASHHG